MTHARISHRKTPKAWRSPVTVFGLCLALHAVAPSGALADCAALQCAQVPPLEQGLQALERGDAGTAFQLAKTAFDMADSHVQKQRAARLAAASLTQAGQHTRAQWWLRRAANHATDQDTANQIRSEFQSIRRDNPLQVQLGFSFGASDNVNGGASDKSFSLGDIELELGASSLALSGVEFSGSLDLDYRISQSAIQRTSMGLSAYGRTYALSNTAKASAPEVAGSDYALTQLEVALRHRRVLGESLGPSSISLHLGKTWYGGSELWDYQRLALSQEFQAGPSATFTLGAVLENRDARAVDQPNATVLGLNASYAKRLNNQDVLKFNYQARQLTADIATYEYSFHEVAAEYSLARPVLGASLSLRAALSHKGYDVFSLSLNGRRDTSATLSATAVFNQVSRYGFSPSLTIAATRTESNVSRFTTQGLQASFGIQSNF